MIILKRASRMFVKNFFKYLGVMLIIIFGMAVVIGYGNTSFSAKETIDRYWEETNVEDGEFTLYVKLTEDDKKNISDLGISLQDTFYFDIDAGDSFTYRIFKSRENINKEKIIEGKSSLPADNEIRLERVFMEENDVLLNDDLTIDDKDYNIVSKVVVPDYEHRVAEISNVGTDERFALIFVNDNVYDELLISHKDDEVYNYTYTVDKGDADEASDDLYKYLKDLSVEESRIKDTYVLSELKERDDDKKELDDAFDDIKKGAQDIADGTENVNKALGGQIKELTELGKGAEKIADGTSKLHKNVSEAIDELTEYKYPALYRFNKAKDNTRVVDFVDAHKMYYAMSLFLGLLIAILIAYIMSVFSAGLIDNDSKTIGTLYAMGYRKSELMKLYLLVPTIAVTAGSVIGTAFGFKMTDSLIAANYSHPDMIHTYPAVLIAYGIVMPIIITIAINCFTINKKLSRTALEILQNRKEFTTKHSEQVRTNEKEFIPSFRSSQTKKEVKSHLILLFGMILAILIMTLGMALYGSMIHYADSIADDTKFEHMYVLCDPLEKVPEGAERSLTVSLSMYCDMAGSELPVVIEGVEKNSKYFDFAGKLSEDKNLIYASDSAIIKYGCKKGDKLIFTDQLNKKDIVFTMEGDVSYKNGIFFFMDIDAMREYFELPEDYYNTLLSDNELDIDHNMMISHTTKKSIVDTAESWAIETKGTIGAFLVMSIVIFVLVICILVKNMLERSIYQISLLRLIGFRTAELNKVYLNSTVFTAILAGVIGMPLGKVLMDYLIPVMNGSMKSGMRSYIYPSAYLIMSALLIISYLASYLMMQRKISAISTNEVLKDRE